MTHAIPHNATAQARDYFLGLQRNLIQSLEAIDGGSFTMDEWEKPAGSTIQGHGISQVIENSHVLERGGVNFSHVTGTQLPPSAVANRPNIAGCPWEAMGVSLVFHPKNPYVPTVHMNVRFFITHTQEGQAVWWFGGGMDLTPYYGFVEDAIHFHQTCKNAVSPFGDTLHAEFKKWCDDYFYLKHRQEPRGIGGIFFDDFERLGFAQSFAMTQSVGNALIEAYRPILLRRKDTVYGERERAFQAYRRGRYVEFNLVFDRGTHFGLQSGGRTESILMSMPPIAQWRYDWQPEKGSAEAALTDDFLIARDWV